jgi:hypothetical protein
MLCDVAQVAKFSLQEGWTWCGPENTTVVLLGDVVDGFRDYQEYGQPETRSPTVMKKGGVMARANEQPHEEEQLLSMLNDIARSAQRKPGCQLIRLFGNHEAVDRNLQRDTLANSGIWMRAHASPYALQNAGGVAGRIAAFQPRGELYELLSACGVKVIVQVGSWVMVHGGLVKRHIKMAKRKGKHVYEYANDLFARAWSPQGLSDPEEQRLMVKMMFGKGEKGDGMLYDRTLGTSTGSAGDSHYVDKLLRKLNKHNAKFGVPAVEHIVVAHTIQANGINSVCDERVWRVDTALSESMLTKPTYEALLVVNDQKIRVLKEKQAAP